MNSSIFNLHIDRPLTLLLIIPAAVLCWYFFRHTKMDEHEKNLPADLLRLMSMATAVLVMAGVHYASDRAPAETIILADCSGSMSRIDAVSTAEELRAQLEAAGLSATVVAFDEPNGTGPSRTNIGEALLQAADSFGSEVKKHIVLVSDGLETEGSAETVAYYLKRTGAVTDVLHTDSTPQEEEAQISALLLPEVTPLGNAPEAELIIQSNAAMECSVRLTAGDELLLETTEALKKGENRFIYAPEYTKAGKHLLTAEIEPKADTIRENNQYQTAFELRESETILIVDGTKQESALLTSLLKRNGQKTAVCSPEEVPTAVEELCSYRALIMMNVDEQDLPEGSGDALRRYVSIYGGNLLVTGGSNTFNTTDAFYGDMLPVKTGFERPAGAKPLALVILVDCSASMDRNVMNGQTVLYTPMEMARRGAVKCLTALNSDDLVGVVSFSGSSNVIVEMTSPAERDSIVDSILAMSVIDVTQYAKGFTAVMNLLEDVDDAYEKHVVMISDGCSDDHDYEPIVVAMGQAGITLSTIAVGPYMDEEVMESLAIAGGGSYNCAERTQDLPFLMLSNVMESRKGRIISKNFIPASGSSLLAAEANTLPSLGGYLRTEANRDAEVFLTAQDNDPLYAEKAYGAGRAGVFTSDLSGQWSSRWFNDPAGSEMLLTLCRRMAPEQEPADDDAAELSDNAGPGYDPEAEAFSADKGKAVLDRICTLTGGRFLAGETDMGNSSMEGFTADLDLSGRLAALAAALLLAEFALRKIRLRR